VDLFEETVAKYVSSCQSPVPSLQQESIKAEGKNPVYAVACVYGTAALHVALILACVEQEMRFWLLQRLYCFDESYSVLLG
jgi:hypothetical protein